MLFPELYNIGHPFLGSDVHVGQIVNQTSLVTCKYHAGTTFIHHIHLELGNKDFYERDT